MGKPFLGRIAPLLAVLGLAVISLGLVLLALGQSVAGATPDGDGAVSRVQSPSATFIVSGTVTCQATGLISDVEVFVWVRDQGTGWMGDVTDASGAYSVTLSQGDYDLNFIPRCGSPCASQARKGITGPPDQVLDVVLLSGYSISGTVYATNGVNLVGNVATYAFNRETADGFGLPPTDANGRYCFSLVPGAYELSFTPPPCQGLGPTTTVALVTQTIAMNVTLPPGFTVGGRVTNPSGGLVPGVQVYAQDPHVGAYGFAPTNASGYYTGVLPFAGTPPTGTYDIQFIPPAGLGLGGVTVVDVISATSGCPNTSLPITLPTGFTLSGKVTCRGVGIKNTFAYALPVGPQDPQNSLPGWGLFAVDDGSYRLPLVSGTYSLTFTPPTAAGLHTKAFTTTPIITNTVLNVEMCLDGVWVTETVDSDGNVGGGTSLALEPTYPYTPHISYGKNITVNDNDLKYAWLSGGTWFSETADSEGGQLTSLGLAPTYPHTPCISYSDYSTWWLRYACRDGITWTISTLRGQRAGEYGVSLALEPIYPYTPHISYYHPFGIHTLFHAYLSGAIWMSGTWVHEAVEPIPSGAGYWSSLALEPTYPYTPHISYRDLDQHHDLKHAWRNGTTWLTETVDSEGDVGVYTSLVLESAYPFTPHISYYNSTNGDLKHAWRSGSAWFSETVDSDGVVGLYTSLALDSNGHPYISYYDATKGDLKLAWLKGGVWIIQTVDSGGDVGESSSLALDQAGRPHISYYDATNGDLKHAYIPMPKLYLPVVFKN